tara:strand:+ start:87 stop:314 length:228 start_codon:yes stop_codon:yes gene_type:complete
MLNSHSSLLRDTEPSIVPPNKINSEHVNEIKRQKMEELIKITEIIYDEMIKSIKEHKEKTILDIKQTLVNKPPLN